MTNPVEGSAPNSLKSVIEHLNSLNDALPEVQAERSSLTKKQKRARTVARLVLVQALYQMEIGGSGVETVIREFSDYRFEADIDPETEGEKLATADEAYFAEGARAVVKEQHALDAAITERLAAGWRLERLDTTLRAILRAGAWELKFRPDVAVEVVINEYVELARAFYGDTEARFVNAALDGIATDARG